MRLPDYFPRKLAEVARTVLLIVVAIDTALVYMSYRNTLAVIRTMQNNVIEEQVFSDLKDAECGQRGFLYSDGDEAYLPQYYVGAANTKDGMQMLEQYIRDDPASARILVQLKASVSLKLAELDSTVRAYRGGDHEKAKQIFLSGTGALYMEQVRSLIRLLTAEQRNELRKKRWVF